MDLIRDDAELVRRIRQLGFTGGLPAELATRLQSIPGSTADVFCEGAEILYANHEVLDDDALALVGSLYLRAIDHCWTTFNQGDRSAQIVAVIRRELGETGSEVAAEDAEWPTIDEARRIQAAVPTPPPVPEPAE